MIDRKKFAEIFNGYKPGLGDDGSPLWAPEHWEDNEPSKWFISVAPTNMNAEFWQWIEEFCKGQVLCYSSNSEDQEEWWGFTDINDIIWFLIRWS